jgi:hypothetical protein
MFLSAPFVTAQVLASLHLNDIRVVVAAVTSKAHAPAASDWNLLTVLCNWQSTLSPSNRVIGFRPSSEHTAS